MMKVIILLISYTSAVLALIYCSVAGDKQPFRSPPPHETNLSNHFHWRNLL